MLEQKLKKEAAQETPESQGVVRQSAEEFLKERIGRDFMVETKETKGNGLEKFKTCELVKELKKREGVEEIWIEPFEPKTISVNDGPALILVVTD